MKSGSQRGYNQVSGTTSSNKAAGKAAHRPMEMKNQLHPSITSAIAKVKSGHGKVMNDKGSWPAEFKGK